jgi:magnesium chelatase family protein
MEGFMSLAIVYTRANIGIAAPLVTVETHLSNGLPSLTIVGLPETAVRESKERVRSAILNSGLQYPARRITINLAPADLPKSGGRFDLAIALSILAASGQIPVHRLEDYEVLGELALTGALRRVHGVLPAVLAARASGRTLLLPQVNQDEASLVRDVHACAGAHLLDVCRQLINGSGMTTLCFDPERLSASSAAEIHPQLHEIKGQQAAKRALQIAAAGAHNILFIGPPGTGKTMLANSMASLLPELDEAEALEAAAVQSIARQPMDTACWLQPAFRAPHHTATSVALVGGGAQASPGEISLAHRGVLFLDELAEFNRSVLDVLREPLESGVITISRANYRLQLPANFQLVAAMNPCHCGHYGDPDGSCRCTPQKVQAYLNKISGPLLDRIDLIVEVPRLPHHELRPGSGLAAGSETRGAQPDSAALRERIRQCRQLQKSSRGKLNSDLNNPEVERLCVLDAQSEQFLELAASKLNLSARACHRVLRIARTIADLEQRQTLSQQDLSEAIAYRRTERYFKPPP